MIKEENILAIIHNLGYYPIYPGYYFLCLVTRKKLGAEKDKIIKGALVNLKEKSEKLYQFSFSNLAFPSLTSENVSLYMSPSPVDLKKANKKFAKIILNKALDNNSSFFEKRLDVNYATAIQGSREKKVISVDIDIDQSMQIEASRIRTTNSFLKDSGYSQTPLSIIRTQNGFHVILEHGAGLENIYKFSKKEYPNIKEVAVNVNLLPLIQGNKVCRIDKII